MLRDRWILAGFLVSLVVPVAAAQTSGEPDPLFQSNETLDIRIAAPFSAIMRERDSGEEFDGKLQYTNEAGETTEIDVGIRTRGRYRMQQRICSFAPLRLNFKKSQTKDSLFHKQDKVKLVTHCSNYSRRYEQSVLREFLAYRILNELTDISFHTRLLRVTYVDTDNGDAELIRYGFIIESVERLAKRLDLRPITVARLSPVDLQPAHTNLISVFQYLIGNTDFSPVTGSQGVCCHNTTPVGKEDGLVYSVPYDFDQSGLVNALYASPNPRFKLRSARQRLYRGRCSGNQYLDASLDLFEQKREAIIALVREQPGFDRASLRSTTDFVDLFFDTIASPRKVQSRLVKKCI
jgi:hypothetical protein